MCVPALSDKSIAKSSLYKSCNLINEKMVYFVHVIEKPRKTQNYTNHLFFNISYNFITKVKRFYINKSSNI